MALGKIDHIDITVEDLGKTVDFFVNKLGFKVRRETDHAGKSVELTSPNGDFFFDFHQLDDKLDQEWKTGYLGSPGPLRFCHIAFKVDDIDKEFKDLKDSGVKIHQEKPFQHPDTHRKIADVRDEIGRCWIQITDGGGN